MNCCTPPVPALVSTVLYKLLVLMRICRVAPYLLHFPHFPRTTLEAPWKRRPCRYIQPGFRAASSRSYLSTWESPDSLDSGHNNHNIMMMIFFSWISSTSEGGYACHAKRSLSVARNVNVKKMQFGKLSVTMKILKLNIILFLVIHYGEC